MDQTLNDPEIEQIMVQFYDNEIAFDLKGFMTQPTMFQRESEGGGSTVLERPTANKPASDYIKPKTQ